MTTELRVPDASCGHCKSTIESAVSALDDITLVELDLVTRRLRVEHGNSVRIDHFVSAIKNAGDTPEPAV